MRKRMVITAIILGFVFGCASITFFGFTLNGNGTHPQITTNADGKYVYIIDSYNVFRSEDYGKTWDKIDGNTFK
jgi:hypothetical protein